MKSTQGPNLYQRLGGSDAITAMVDVAIGNISIDAHINRRFGTAGGAQLTRNLVDLVCARTGGT
jgi:hypothetical protein